MKNNVIISKEAIVEAIGVHTQANSKKVFCISTGEIFVSVSDAAIANNVSQSFMSNVIKRAINGGTCNGKRFCFVSDILVHIDEFAKNYRDAVNYEEIQRKEQESILLNKIRVLEEKLMKHQCTYDHLIEETNKVKSKIMLIKDQLSVLYDELKNL